MTAPPEKKAKKDSNTISMVVEKWRKDQVEQFSAVHRINGYPFRLQLRKLMNLYDLTLLCDKSTEAELWQCTATLSKDGYKTSYTFCSWEARRTGGSSFPSGVGQTLTITVNVEDDGDSWRLRPIPSLIGPPDGILVVGEEKKKIEVNKEFLASQSPFFDRLFFGSFKEKDMDEIPIGDVEYEEFSNIIKLLYGSEGVTVKNENALDVLDLADRFELKIVEDKAVSFLLSDRCRLTLAQKLLAAHDRGHQFLKKKYLDLFVVNYYNGAIQKLRSLKGTPEFEMFSSELKVDILDYLVNGS